MDRNAISSPSPPPLPPLPAVESTPVEAAAAAAALVDGHDRVLAAVRLFLTDERRFGPDPGGRKRNESLTQPAYTGGGRRAVTPSGYGQRSSCVTGWARGKRGGSGDVSAKKCSVSSLGRRSWPQQIRDMIRAGSLEK